MVTGAVVCSMRKSAVPGVGLPSANTVADADGPPPNGVVELAVAEAAEGPNVVVAGVPTGERPPVATARPLDTTFGLVAGVDPDATPERIWKSRRSLGWSRNCGSTSRIT